MNIPRTGILRSLSLAGLILLAPWLVACKTNPTTGRSQFTGLSRKEEIAIGTQHKPEMIKEMGGEVAQAELRQYVTEIGMRLVATTSEDDPSLKELPWEFTMLRSDVINAFALPGGKVFMSMGLAKRMDNEAQFAAVLGHEIGHVAARHISERYGQTMTGQIGLLGVGILAEVFGMKGAGQLVKQGAQSMELVFRGFDRDQELEADALGVRYMSRIGYNPLGSRQVMEILKREANGKYDAMSTHPHPESRIQQIDALLAGPYKATQSDPMFSLREQEYQQRFKRFAVVVESDPRDELFLALMTRVVPTWAECDGACGGDAEHSAQADNQP